MRVKAPAKFIVVSAREVVILQGVTVPVAFACASVPLGLPALSVSIRIPKSTLGDDTFASDNLRVEALTPFPKIAMLMRVLPATSHTSC